MLNFIDNTILRSAIGGLAIAIAVALQFVPLYHKQLEPLAARWPWPIWILRSRIVQLAAGFFLLMFGIDILK